MAAYSVFIWPDNRQIRILKKISLARQLPGRDFGESLTRQIALLSKAFLIKNL